MYRLDLETLLLILRGRSGLLEAFIQSLPGLRGNCKVVVTLVNGKIAACVIQDQQGSILSGERALQLLQKRVTEWTYQENASIESSEDSVGQQIPLIPPQMSPRRSFESEAVQYPIVRYQQSPLHAIPRRVEQSLPYQFQYWTRLQRSIFMLIDGTHSIGVIASLLHQNEEATLSIIMEMATQGVVKI